MPYNPTLLISPGLGALELFLQFSWAWQWFSTLLLWHLLDITVIPFPLLWGLCFPCELM